MTNLPEASTRKPRARTVRLSAVSTGRRQFVAGDGRGRWARRYSDLVQMHCEDMGGADNVSSAQLSLARRAATIECQLESMEGSLSQGGTIDLDLFVRATGALNRVLKTLGIKRTKPRGPTLAEYVASRTWQKDRETVAAAEPSGEPQS